MKQNKKTKKTESGRSMIEMVGVLAVMGLITAGAFVLISSAMSSQKTSRVDDDVSAIVAGTRLLYNNATDFTGLSSDALGAIGFEGKTSPYGEDYYLNVGSDKSTFYVGIGNLTTSQAKALSHRDWPGGNSNVECCTDKEFKTCVPANKCDKATSVRITFPKVQTKF